MSWSAKCTKCGEIMDSTDLAKDYTDGGYRGEPHLSCPYCGCDELDEVEQCSRCGKWVEGFDLSHLIYGSVGNEVCLDCLQDAADDVRTVIDYGAKRTEDVEINGLWAYVYTKDEINDILMADFMKLPERMQKQYTQGFAECDYSDFAEEMDA